MTKIFLFPILFGVMLSTPLPAQAIDSQIDWVQLRREATEYRTRYTLSESLVRAGVPQGRAEEWARYFIRYGRETNTDPFLLAAIAHQESDFVPSAKHPRDASWGLMQVMIPYWRRAFVRECGAQATSSTMRDPETAICYGAYILAAMRRYVGGNERLGILAYNRGPMSVLRAVRNGRSPENGYGIRIQRRLASLRSPLRMNLANNAQQISGR